MTSVEFKNLSLRPIFSAAGFQNTTFLIIGVALLVLGLALVLFTRRRRTKRDEAFFSELHETSLHDEELFDAPEEFVAPLLSTPPPTNPLPGDAIQPRTSSEAESARERTPLSDAEQVMADLDKLLGNPTD